MGPKHPEAIKYLKTICDPLTKLGVEVIENEDNPGAFAVVPKSNADFGSLVGKKGATADHIRSLFRVWAGANGMDTKRTNVLITNLRQTKTELV